MHYAIGIAALILSTLVASKPTWIGASGSGISLLAWLVAVFTGLLTFLIVQSLILWGVWCAIRG